MKEMSFDNFKEMLLYRSIVEWNREKNYIMLDNGIKITVITEPKYSAWEDSDTYGCSAVVKMLHNQNLICEVDADADVGNGGYYFSVASFIINYNDLEFCVHLVGSDDC